MLFFDEVGELLQDIQVKLFRVFQESEIDLIGSCWLVKVDFWFILVINCCLIDQVKDGVFCEDFYYCLNVFLIWILFLWDCCEDILVFVWYFLVRFVVEEGKLQVVGVVFQVLVMFQDYNWFGNICQFENIVFCVVVLCDGVEFMVDDFLQIVVVVVFFVIVLIVLFWLVVVQEYFVF